MFLEDVEERHLIFEPFTVGVSEVFQGDAIIAIKTSLPMPINERPVVPGESPTPEEEY